ncbi:MBL fold metallo-hydrolase [Candidatus Woesearchaeota archaeon]|nr:MBL fold metallo-hydrolase [Candidatus Woesearchaeota archaeon]
MHYNNLQIDWFGHDCFLIQGSKRIMFDPFQLPTAVMPPVDVLFISHEHFDHCSIEDIKKVISSSTVIVTIPDCVSKVSRLKVKNIIPMNPNEKKEVEGLVVETLPAYNINKFRSPGLPFHPPEDGRVGFIVAVDNKRVYHAGDTDFIPEIKSLFNIDVALVPVSGTYVMTAQEAANAVNTFRPRLAIPMHYGSIVGSLDDAHKFKELAQVSVEVLDKSA